MFKTKINSAIELLTSFNSLGVEKDIYSYKIGKAKHIAEFAWLHVIYAPLDEHGLNELNVALGSEIPSDYRAFLKIANGLSIFTNSITLFGKREDNNRSIDTAWRYPFDLLIPNIKERPELIPKNYFYIGSYKKDGSQLVILNDTNEVLRLEKQNNIVLNRWDGLPDFLNEEIKRMLELFNGDGTMKNEPKTIPALKGIAVPPRSIAS